MSLKTLRHKNKMSQSQLARACGTTIKTVSFWENKRSIPRLKAQISIAKILRIPLAQLQSQCNWPVMSDIVIVGLEA